MPGQNALELIRSVIKGMSFVFNLIRSCHIGFTSGMNGFCPMADLMHSFQDLSRFPLDLFSFLQDRLLFQ